MTRQICISALLLLLLIPGMAYAQVSEVDMLVSSGWENYRAGLYLKAVQDFSAAVRKDRENSSAAEGLGAAALQLQDWPKAKDGYESAHRLSPGDCGITKNLAYVYMRLNLEGRAEEFYEKVVGLPGKPGCEPGDIASKVSLGQLYYHSKDEGQRARAIQLFNQIINGEEEAEPGYMQRAHFYLGNLYLKKKNYDLAIKNLEAAYQLDPTMTDGRFNLGRLYFNKKNYDKALEHLLIALDGKENDYQLNLMLGLCYMELGRKGETDALLYLSKARNLMQLLNQQPNNIPHQQLAELYNKTGEYAKAIEISDEGLRLIGSDPTARAGLICTKGKGLEGRGKYEEALDLFESVLDDPTWGNYARKQVERQESLLLRKAAQEG